MSYQIQLRRDTAANWTATNPVLAQGELGVETDAQKTKMGDGVTPWTLLDYWLDPTFVPVIDHGALTGLADDDHTQYHTDARALTWLGTRSTDDLPEGSKLYFTTERAQDAVCSIFTDTNSIDFTYDDAGNSIIADLKLSANAAATNFFLIENTIESATSLGLRSQVRIADATHTGVVSLTDWNTFNNKQPAGSYAVTTTTISTTAPITGGGDLSANRTFAIAKATGAVDGFLAALDFAIFAAKQDALTFSHPLLNTAGTVSFEYNTTNLKITANQLNTIQDISTSANVHFGNLLDCFSRYTFDEGAWDYTNGGRNLVGGTFTSGFLTNGATGNAYAAAYHAMADITISTTFNCDDPTQSESNIFVLGDSTSVAFGNLTTFLKVCVNEGYFSDTYDYVQVMLVVSGVAVMRWHSTAAAYNDQNWHNIAVRIGASGTKIMIDGVVNAGVYTVGSSSTPCGPNLLPACDRVNFGNSKLALAKFHVFNRALLDYEMGNVCELSDVHPIIDSISNLKGLGFNGATASTHFMNCTMMAQSLNGPAKGIIKWANNATYSTAGSAGNIIDISTYRCDYSGNTHIYAAMSDGVCGNNNYAAKFTNINNAGNGATDTCTALWVSSDDNGSGGQANAIYNNLGDYFFGAANFGLNFNKKSKITHDGTNLILNNVSGHLKFAAAADWTTTPPAGATHYLILYDNTGTAVMVKGQYV